MTPVEKGKFCSTCQKKVFDLTKASDKEIIEILQNDVAACGRFTSSQLNRNLYTNQQKSSYWLMACATLFGFIGLGNHSSYAQVKNDTIKVETKVNVTFKDSINSNSQFRLKGTVSDELGPLPGATVVIKGTIVGVTTDFNGVFEIDAKMNDTLEVSFVGKHKILHKIVNNEILVINLKENAGSCTIGLYTTSYKERTFFGRIFYKIGNLFR